MSMLWASLRRMRINHSYTVVIILILLLLIAGSQISDRFLTWRNFSTLFQQMVVLSIASLGQTVVILTGGIDLAIGQLVGSCTVLLANMLDWQPDLLLPAILLLLVFGAGIGLLNGALIVGLRHNPLIVTLGTASALLGATLLYSKVPSGSVPEQMEDMAYGDIFGLPIPAVATLVVFLLCGIWLRYTRSGRAIYFVGGSPESARLNGISVGRVLLYAYAFSGLCSAIAAFFLTARMGIGDPRIGATLTLSSITPVVVGGTTLAGGRGGVIGTLLGAFLVSLLNNLLNYMNVSSFYQWVVQGLIIIAAVGLLGRRNR